MSSLTTIATVNPNQQKVEERTMKIVTDTQIQNVTIRNFQIDAEMQFDWHKEGEEKPKTRTIKANTHKKRETNGDLHIEDIVHTTIPIGTIITARCRNYKNLIREYKVIKNYPTFVLCERVAKGGRYVKCFMKRDIICRDIPYEAYEL